MSSLVAPTPVENQRGASEALPLGTRLDEFELRSVLGMGGFGIVYLAWDHALEREVALKEYMPITLASRGEGSKVLLRSQAESETFTTGLRSFVNEARLLARFDHPALVKVHRFWEANGTAYMVMPFYRGRTLRQVRHAMVQPLDEAACRRLIDPLLSALELLHHEDVFHRDIAPDNILVSDDGAPVLLDFGAARKVVGSTRSVTAILKPNFAPLEQYGDVSSMHQGPWTDLYSLGATVHYLLRGQPPPPAASRALCDEFTPLAAQNVPGCSIGFLRAIDSTLALRPQDRPQSVAALRAALGGDSAGIEPSRRAVAPAIVLPPAGTHYDPTQPVPRTAAAAAGPARSLSMTLWVALAGALVLAALLWWALKPMKPVRRMEAKPAAAMRVAASPPVVAPRPVDEPRPSPEAASPEAASPARRHAAVARPAPVADMPIRQRRIDASPQEVPIDGPRQRCADRMVVTRLVCVKRECLRPQMREHPDCRRLEELEQQARREQPQHEP